MGTNKITNQEPTSKMMITQVNVNVQRVNLNINYVPHNQPQLNKVQSRDDFEIEMPFKKPNMLLEMASAAQSTVGSSNVPTIEEDGKAQFSDSSSASEEEAQLSESEQSSACQSDVFSSKTTTTDAIPEFKQAAEPKKYMTAADFERVCNQLQKLSTSYDKTAKRYEKAIEVTEKTIKTCQRGE